MPRGALHAARHHGSLVVPWQGASTCLGGAARTLASTAERHTYAMLQHMRRTALQLPAQQVGQRISTCAVRPAACSTRAARAAAALVVLLLCTDAAGTAGQLVVGRTPFADDIFLPQPVSRGIATASSGSSATDDATSSRASNIAASHRHQPGSGSATSSTSVGRSNGSRAASRIVGVAGTD